MLISFLFVITIFLWSQERWGAKPVRHSRRISGREPLINYEVSPGSKVFARIDYATKDTTPGENAVGLAIVEEEEKEEEEQKDDNDDHTVTNDSSEEENADEPDDSGVSEDAVEEHGESGEVDAKPNDEAEAKANDETEAKVCSHCVFMFFCKHDCFCFCNILCFYYVFSNY